MKLTSFTKIVLAGSQFTPSDPVKIHATHPRKWLRLVELNLHFGTESKSYRVEKVDRDGNVLVLIQQSFTSLGVPGDSTAESLLLVGSDIESLFQPGDQLAITTTGATSAMRATAYFAEVDPDV